MDLYINEEKIIVQSPCTVEQLLIEIKKNTSKYLALAINEAIVPQAAWKEKLLEHNDQITIITPTQGG
ncbi:MAG: sulfur carrier protein ThiS [SAR324 cluster bacterium]|nr:sulfur carrier protein ThiS [SAR324 cluster bacterium]